MKTIFAIIFLTNILFATSTEIVKKDTTKTYNQVDDNYKDEKGFAFYEDLKNKKKKKHRQEQESKDCCENLLKISKKILKENEKQTKIQEKILALLQEHLDPKPKKIIVDGKECVENSSAKCFKMPLTPEAKSIPAMAAWMKNPSMKNTVNFLQWEAKYFKEVFKRGNSLPMATNQFGDKAYPLPNQTIGYTDLMGFNEKKKQMRTFMKKINKNYNYILFFGMNEDLDLISISSIRTFMNKYPKVSLTIAFKDNNSKKLFESGLKALYSKSMISKIERFKMITGERLFKTYKIYATPSIVAIDKKENKAHAVMVGRFDIAYFEDNMYNLLEYEGKIDYKDFMDHRTWDGSVNYRDRYFKRTNGININSLIKEQGAKK